TGGDTVERRPAGAAEQGEVRQRRDRLLLQLARDVHAPAGQLLPLDGVDRLLVLLPAVDGGAGKGIEVERAFTRAEVDADLIEIEVGPIKPGRLPRLGTRRQGKLRVAPAVEVVGDIGNVVGEVE